jgi:ATP-dependent DNA helicase RecG
MIRRPAIHLKIIRWAVAAAGNVPSVTSMSGPAAAEQVARWVSEGESDHQEFKESTGQRTAAAHALCGMVNLHGGRVLFGVSPDGRVVGQQVTDQTLEKLHAALVPFDPEITPTIERVEIGESREVIVVAVQQGRYRPYRYKGVAYKRIGAVTAEMSREEYERLFLEQLHTSDRWETEPATLTLDDLDHAEIGRALDDAVRRGRVSEPLSRDPLDLLRGLGLVKGGGILNAGAVLFARSDRLLPDYPQCLVKLARFRGVIRGESIADERQQHGNAFALLRQAEEFCRIHLPVAARLDPNSMIRHDEPEIPVLALREALANAVSHREYSTAAGSIGVFIYDDRVEVASIGGLHFGLSVDDLLRPHESQPWNPLIAGALYRRGVVDSLGSGIQRMIRMVEEARLLPPTITDTGTSVLVTFHRRGAVPMHLRDRGVSRDGMAVLRELLAARSPLPLRDLLVATSSEPGLSEQTVREELQRLRRLDMVESGGTGRGARWTLTGHAEDLLRGRTVQHAGRCS